MLRQLQEALEGENGGGYDHISLHTFMKAKNKLKTNQWKEFKPGKLKFIFVQLKSRSYK